jgi:acyl-coenzyme A synthetase/AMP-(fatty) acid ligase
VLDLVALVERSAARRPRQLAVVTAAEALTYSELLDRAAGECTAGRVSRRIRRSLVARDAADVAVALVASAMAGSALLMVDPAAPAAEAERAEARFGLGSMHNGLPVGLGLTTSGVTGEPRCVVRPWSLVCDNAAAFAEALGLTSDDVVMTTSSMHHSYAVSAGLCGALTAGAAFVAPGGMLPPKALARHIDRHGVSVLLSVPMLYRWYAVGVPVAHAPRLCVSAGAPVDDGIRKAWDAAVGWPLVEHYGTSEMGQLTVGAAGDAGSVGRSLRGVHIRAAHVAATGECELEASVDGPPPVLLDIAEGAIAPRPLTGWSATGDVGDIDGEGRVRIHGRRGDIVNVGGKKVALREVEAALRSMPGVSDCAVIARTDATVVPKLYAFVEADQDFSAEHAAAHLKEQLAPHKIPRQVLRVEHLPRTGSGKVRLHDLERLIAAPATGTVPAAPAAPTAVTVPFDGPGAGVCPLTWGARSIRRSIEWLGEEAHYFNDPNIIAIPEGISLDTVTAGLGALVSRHQSLRTYYPVVDGDVVMRVERAGTFEVSIESVLPDADPRARAAELAQRCARPLFTERELPLRCAVVQSAGVPLFLVLILSHQSIDAWAVDVIRSELRLLWAGREDELSSQPWQLLDQAADEESGQSHARGLAALRYWRAFYAAADPSLFDAERRMPEPQPVHSVKMTSPCTQAATELAAARLRVSTSAVLAGIVAVVLGQLSAHERITLLLIAANRFDERRRQLVAPMVEDVLCRVDLRDDVDTVIRDAAKSTLAAYINACYDPPAEQRIRHEAELERGARFDFHGAIFNDVRARGKWLTDVDEAVTAADLGAMRAATTFEPGGRWNRQNTTFFARIIGPSDTCRIELMADTHYVALADMPRVLAAIESIAVAAAARTVALGEVAALCDVPRLTRGPRWLRRRGGWVDVAAAKALLRGLPQIRAATVAAGAGAADGHPALTAYVYPDAAAGAAGPADVHRALVAAIRDADTAAAAAPDRYVICASAPEDDDCAQAWSACEVLASGDGRAS